MADTEAVLFDFDGVLAESSEIKVQAFAELYREHGPEVVEAVVAHHLAHEGISRITKIRHCHKTLLGIDLIDDALAELGARFSTLVEEAVVAAAWVPGAQDFLDAHLGRVGMFVVSGTPQEELRRITARRGMDRYFVSVRGSPPTKEPIIREILAEADVPPERAAFVGDAMTDHDAARTVGLRFVGRIAPHRQDPFPAGTETIADLTELRI